MFVEAACSGAQFTFDELHVDGGAVKNNLLCQLQADILGIPVVRPKNAESRIFGAMLLAGHVEWASTEISTSWQPPGPPTGHSSPR